MLCYPGLHATSTSGLRLQESWPLAIPDLDGWPSGTEGSLLPAWHAGLA